MVGVWDTLFGLINYCDVMASDLDTYIVYCLALKLKFLEFIII